MPISRIRRLWHPHLRLPVLGVFVLLTGGICTPPPKWDPPGIPEIAAVEVTPSVVYAAPNTSFELKARVFSTADHVIPIGAYPQITIEWSPAGLFSDPRINPVIVKVPAASGGISNIKATVTRVVNRPNTGRTETALDATVEIRVATSTTFSAGTADEFSVEYVPDRRPVAVILDASDGARCINDWSLAVVKTASLGHNLVPGCGNAPENAPELAVFSSDREMVFKDKSKMPDWTSGADARSEPGLPLPNMRSIGVIIGLDVDTGLVRARVTDEVKRAHEFLDRNRAGFMVEPAVIFVHGHTQQIQDPDAACGSVFLEPLLEEGGFNIKDDPDLFVLFVPGFFDDTRGYACPRGEDHAGRVIYVSLQEFHATTLVHELGHILSLSWPSLNWGNGHSNHIGAFKQDNIMWNMSDFAIRSRRDHLSVGQVFRMNLSADSWLNEILDPALVVARDCQPEITVGVCPAIDMDFREPGN